MHLLLLGLRGSGKSTLGRLASKRLSCPFIDLDDRTTAHCGMDAARCFAELGEDAWRTAEATAIREALDESCSVIALGGGTPTAPGVEELMLAARDDGRARIIWLDAPDDILLSRAGSDPARPALTALSGAAEVAAIRSVRDPIFIRLSSLRIDTAEGDLDQVLDRLLGDDS